MLPQYDGDGIRLGECSTAMATFRLALHAGATHGLDGWHAVCDAIGMPYLLEVIPDKQRGSGMDDVFDVPPDALQRALQLNYSIPPDVGQYLTGLFTTLVHEACQHNTLMTFQSHVGHMARDLRDGYTRSTGSYAAYVMTSIYYVARYLRSNMADDNAAVDLFAILANDRYLHAVELPKAMRKDKRTYNARREAVDVSHARYDANLDIVRRMLHGLEKHYGYAAIRAQVKQLARLCRVNVSVVRPMHTSRKRR